MKINNALIFLISAIVVVLAIWLLDNERMHIPVPQKQVEIASLPNYQLDTAIKIQDSFYEYIVMVEKGIISRATMDKICQPLKPKLDSIIATLSTSDRHRFDSISQEHANMMVNKLAN